MDVDEEDQWAVYQEFHGEKFYFCSVDCKMIFGRDPLSFIRQNKHVQEKAMDNVCGMEIEKEDTKFRHQYHNQWYYFCSQSCMREFERNPQRYVKSRM